ncbi:MAG TPA: OmpA family protein [Paludibacter sp.]|nr:OmpA family protein [Paludibacter sp.]
MRHIILSILFLMVFVGLHSQEQKPVKKPSIGLHFFYNDVETAQRINATSLSDVLKNGNWNKANNMEGGFGLDYLQGLTSYIDLIGTFNGSWADYLQSSGTYYGSSNFLLDVSAGAHFKLLTDKSVVSPFLLLKANYQKYKALNGFSVAPGVGFQISLWNEAFVLTTLEYRKSLSSSISNQLYYSVGFATNFGKSKPKPVKVIAPLPVVEIPKLISDIKISVTDEATGQALPYVEVTLNGAEGKKLYGTTDANGQVTFNQLTAADYSVQGMLNNINTSGKNISKSDFESKRIDVNISHNDPRFTLSGVVMNKTKNMPEAGAEINVSNLTKHSVSSKQSKAGDGTFLAQLEAESDFTVVGKKADYISNIEKVSTKGLNRSATLYVKLELGIEEAKVGQSIVLNNIYFETGKALVKADYSTDLDKLIQFLNDNPTTRLEIQGHTDNTGNVNVNNKLSQARAESVVKYLNLKGISSNRLTAKGYGQTMPITTNSTEEGRQKNRRVEMKVIQ